MNRKLARGGGGGGGGGGRGEGGGLEAEVVLTMIRNVLNPVKLIVQQSHVVYIQLNIGRTEFQLS